MVPLCSGDSMLPKPNWSRGTPYKAAAALGRLALRLLDFHGFLFTGVSGGTGGQIFHLSPLYFLGFPSSLIRFILCGHYSSPISSIGCLDSSGNHCLAKVSKASSLPHFFARNSDYLPEKNGQGFPLTSLGLNLGI